MPVSLGLSASLVGSGIVFILLIARQLSVWGYLNTSFNTVFIIFLHPRAHSRLVLHGSCCSRPDRAGNLTDKDLAVEGLEAWERVPSLQRIENLTEEVVGVVVVDRLQLGATGHRSLAAVVGE